MVDRTSFHSSAKLRKFNYVQTHNSYYISNMEPKNYILRQIRISNKLYNRIKQHCKTNKKTMTQLYHEVLAWFIENVAQTPTLVYHASYKRGQVLSLWLEETQLKAISQLALQAKVSDARVIYTAIILYSQMVDKFY